MEETDLHSTSSQVTLSADDRYSIGDLLARYAQAFDNCDEDGVTESFTETGVLKTPAATYVGRKRILEKLAETRGRTGQRHFVTNTVIDPVVGDSGQVHARSYYIYSTAGSDGVKIEGTGTYEDDLVMTTNGWRIQARKAVSDAKSS